MRVSSLRRLSSEAGFKLAELMIAVAVLAIGGGIAYPLLISDLSLYTRNFSLNKSDNSLRYSLQRLKKDIDMAIEPPWLVNYSVNGSAGVLTPQASATSAQGILLWVNLGPSYDLQPTSPTNSSVPVTGTMTLNRRVNTLGPPNDPFPNSPMPQIGDRLVIQSPSVYSTGMPENATMNGVSILKPGRRIISVNGQTSNPVLDNGASSITVKVDLTNTPLPTTITGPQSVYIVREVAYVVNTLNDSFGNPAERQLLCYPTTNDLTTSLLLIRDVDPTPSEIDPITNAIIQPFNYYYGRGTQSPLSLNLPVRAIDYANVITTHQAAASSQFNVYLRSSPQMGGKVRLD